MLIDHFANQVCFLAVEFQHHFMCFGPNSQGNQQNATLTGVILSVIYKSSSFILKACLYDTSIHTVAIPIPIIRGFNHHTCFHSYMQTHFLFSHNHSQVVRFIRLVLPQLFLHSKRKFKWPIKSMHSCKLIQIY